MYEIESKLIEKSGLTATNQRIMILHFIYEIADHPTADDIIDWTQKHCPKISVATIYNTLNAFVEKGMIHAMSPPGSKTIYYDKNTHHHYHLVDTKTGKFQDINPTSIQFSHQIEDYAVEKVDVFIYAHKK
ncbi:MAG: Fur family transcriptional regulator [Candidatus Berkiella sp.]